ncbi:phosphoadenosine phosphosulfate reductase family protein, partial [Bacteroidota bacterium]
MKDLKIHRYIDELNAKFSDSSSQEVLSYFYNKYKDKIAFSSSMGLEDQVLTHLLVSVNKNANIFTLDTGRLFQETYDLIEKTNNRYGIKIKLIFPDANEVEEMVNKKGINLFFESI